MKTKVVVSIVFLILAIAGIIIGVRGLVITKITVSGSNYNGVYDLAEKRFNGTMGWSSSGGLSTGMDVIRKQAAQIRNWRIWGGFISAALFTCIGVIQLTKVRRKN